MPTESIRVVARFRPINSREKEEWKIQGETTYKGQDMVPVKIDPEINLIKIKNGKSKNAKPYRFTFDEVMWWATPQAEAFTKIAEPVCANSLQGFNGTVFAYGQTGSGKTFSMLGPEVQETFNPTLSGLIPRAANYFFHMIENLPTIEKGELEVSFMETYLGSVRDLNPDPQIERPDLKIRQTKKGATYVENLHKVKVTTLAHVLKLISIANSNRTMAYTKMNATSSRSHFIMYYYLKLFQTPAGGGTTLVSKCAFVDLAGSEKVKKTGASGNTLKEAQSINQGLLTLSRVIEGLSKGKKAGAVPFRDSILTWILKDSLAGNTKTTLLIALSPHLFNRDETVTTCRFGARCKKIKMRVNANAELTKAQMKALIKKLTDEVEDLKEQLAMGGGKKKKKKKKADDAGDEEDGDDDGKEGGGGGMSEEERQLLENYKNRNEELRGQVHELEEQLAEAKQEEKAGKLTEEDQQKLNEYDDLLNDRAERDNLRDELENQEMSKRNLAIMNALLAEKLDQRDSDGTLNEQNIVDLARGNLEHLKKHKKTLLQQLQELHFNDAEAQEVYFSVFEDIIEVAREQEEREKENKDLEHQQEKLGLELEQANREISQLQHKLDEIDTARHAPTETPMIGDEDEEYKYNMAGGGGKSIATEINVQDLNAQEEYFQQVAEQQNEAFKEKEEKAWKAFLKRVAEEQDFEKVSELIKSRRQEAEQMLRDGEIDIMPEDDELLFDIREEFERLYDHATGKVRDWDEMEDDLDIPPVEYLDDVSDEDAVDDPFEWDEDEVAEWLMDQGLTKYAKKFRKECIYGRVLLIELNKTNLKRDLGVKSIHVNQLLTNIQELRFRSDGYEQWKVDNKMEEEPIGGPSMNRMATIDPRIMNARKGMDKRTDYELGYVDLREYDEEDDFVLTEEEKALGENFWQIDELFDILDIHKTGVLDLVAFKHGLHALAVQMTDEQMELTFSQIAEHNPDGRQDVLTYKGFIKYAQLVDMLPQQSKRFAQAILDAIPKVAHNRRQYVTRAAMVIKYAHKYNNTKREINNYLQNKGLHRAEILTAWKQYRFNPKAIRDIDFKSMLDNKKGKIVDMAVRDPEHVSPFDPFTLYKLMQRAGFKGFKNSEDQSTEFNDLDYLKASGSASRIWSIKCWWAPKSGFFNGFQVTYLCANGQRQKAGKNMVAKGDVAQPYDMVFRSDEVLESVTVYFAHFVCGVRFQTNRTTKTFGTDQARMSTTLQAPAGTSIMAFYGSMGRLFETLGCYVVSHGQRGGKRKHKGHHQKTSSFGGKFSVKNTSNTTTLSEGGGQTTTY